MLRLGRRCSETALVDDAVQDTFLAVWRSAERYRGEEAVAAWIWGIAIRRLIDRVRRRPREDWAGGQVARSEPSAEELVLAGILRIGF